MKAAGSSRRPKILIVAPQPPFPLDRGGNVRLWSLCRELKDRYSFALLCYAPPALCREPAARLAVEMRLSAVFDETDFVPFEGDPAALWWEFSSKAVREGPAAEALGERLQAALRRLRPAAVHIEHVQLAHLRRYVRGVPAILSEHDVGWVRLRRSLRREGGSLGRRLADWAAGLWDYHGLCRDFDGVVVMSPADLAWWRQWGPAGVPSELVPTGADLAHFAFRGQEPPMRRPELLFAGYYRHAPNADAARHFLDDIWPRLRAELPTARVTFAGAEPPDWLRERAGGGVRVAGFVEDLRPVLRAAHVFIAPIRLGGGVKGKLAEAWAAGVPVVALASALDGYGPETAGFARAASDAKSFAKETIYLLKNKSLRVEMSTKARRWAEENLSWKDCAARLDRFYGTVVKGRR